MIPEMKGDKIELKYSRNAWGYHGGYVCLLKTELKEKTTDSLKDACVSSKITESRIVGGVEAKEVMIIQMEYFF